MRGSAIGTSGVDGRKRLRTQLGEDVPEPVQNKHRGDVVVEWTVWMSEVGWVSCLVLDRSGGALPVPRGTPSVNTTAKIE